MRCNRETTLILCNDYRGEASRATVGVNCITTRNHLLPATREEKVRCNEVTLDIFLSQRNTETPPLRARSILTSREINASESWTASRNLARVLRENFNASRVASPKFSPRSPENVAKVTERRCLDYPVQSLAKNCLTVSSAARRRIKLRHASTGFSQKLVRLMSLRRSRVRRGPDDAGVKQTSNKGVPYKKTSTSETRRNFETSRTHGRLKTLGKG